MTIEDWVLRFEHFSEQEIAQIHATLPDAQHLLEVAQKLLPQIEGLIDTLQQEKARINRVVPVIKMVVTRIQTTQKEFGY